MADGLSTGVFILGPERGMALVERLPDVEAVIVTADNRVLISSGLTGRVAHASAGPLALGARLREPLLSCA